MKRLILIGVALATTQPSLAQAPDEHSAAPQLLCRPFVHQATDLLAYVQSAEARGFVPASNDVMRRVAAATINCAESETRLWSRAEADAQLAAAESGFNVGTRTSLEVKLAQVEVEKANYCEAAFSFVTSFGQQHGRRLAVGIVNAGDITPMLVELETLVPVCGRTMK